MSSVFGILGAAGRVAYSASKFAVRGFSESLRAELVDAGIGVTVLHPGGVRTRIALSALSDAGLSKERTLKTVGPNATLVSGDLKTFARRLKADVDGAGWGVPGTPHRLQRRAGHSA